MRLIVLFLASATLSVTSCAPGTYMSATYLSSQVYVGMGINEFKAIAGKRATLYTMSSDYTILRAQDIDFWYDVVLDTRFYYFDQNGKLVKIDAGQLQQERIQVEIK